MTDVFADLREIKERIQAAHAGVIASRGPSIVLTELQRALNIIEEWED